MKSTLKGGRGPAIKIKEGRGDLIARATAKHYQTMKAIRAAEAMELEPAYNDGDFQHDRITAANDSLLTQATYQEPLTQFISGASDDADLDAHLDFFAPPVQVPRRFEYKTEDTDQIFYAGATNEDLRAIGGDFSIMSTTNTDVTAKTVNRGLAIDIDEDEVKDIPQWEQVAAMRLMKRLKRNMLRRAIAALVAAATNTAKTWGSSADPDGDILAEVNTAAGITGVDPQRLGFGRTAWNTRFTAYRAQNNAGAYASSNLTPQQVADLVGMDQAILAKARYTSAADTKSLIVGTKVFLFLAEAGLSQEDPSNIKAFWSPALGGGRFAVRTRQVGDKKWRVIVEHFELMKITHTKGIRTLTIS